MSEFMSHSLTRREKAMLLVLLLALVIGLYFLVVHYPIVNRMEEIDRDTEDLDKQIEAAEVKSAEYSSMKTELDEILAQPEASVMPPYNNIEPLMRKLDVIFAGTNPDFSFGQATISESVATRTISFSCTAKDYQSARGLLRDVTGTGWRCLLNSFTMTPVEGDLYEGEIRVSGVITFYEYVQTAENAQN